MARRTGARPVRAGAGPTRSFASGPASCFQLSLLTVVLLVLMGSGLHGVYAQLQSRAPWPIGGGGYEMAHATKYTGPRVAPSITWTVWADGVVNGNGAVVGPLVAAFDTLKTNDTVIPPKLLLGFRTAEAVRIVDAVDGSEEWSWPWRSEAYVTTGLIAGLVNDTRSNTFTPVWVFGVDETVYVFKMDEHQEIVNEMFTASLNPWITMHPNGGFLISIGTWLQRIEIVIGDTIVSNSRWSVSTPGAVMLPPSVHPRSGRVYAATVDNTVLALDGDTGSEMWNQSMPTAAICSPVVGKDGKVYVIRAVEGPDPPAALLAYDGEHGTQVWGPTTISGSKVVAGISVAPSGFLYVACFVQDAAGSTVHACSNATGNCRRVTEFSGKFSGPPIMDIAGVLYAALDNGEVLAFVAASESLRWSVNITVPLIGGPIIGDSEQLFVATAQGAIHMLNTSATPTQTPTHTASCTPLQPARGTPTSSGHATATRSLSPSPAAQSELAHPTRSPSGSAAITPQPSPPVATSPWPAIESAASTRAESPSSGALPATSMSMPSVAPAGPHVELVDGDGLPLPAALDQSDASPPLHATLRVFGCGSDCVVWCNVTAPGIAVAPARPRMASRLDGATEEKVAVWARFQACDGGDAARGELSCCAKRARDAATCTVRNIRCRSAPWPRIHDAIVVLPGGVLKPSWAQAWNATEELLSACPTCATAAQAFADAPALQTVIWRLLQERLQRPTAPAGAFSIIAVPESVIVLSGARRPDVRGPRGHFNDATMVTIGAAVARVLWVSSGGHLLAVQIPPAAELCPLATAGAGSAGAGVAIAGAQDCGYRQITITNPAGREASLSMSCPPFCPDDFPGTVPVATAQPGNATVLVPVPAQIVDDLPPMPIAITSMPSSGLYITQGCTGQGFVSPALGICTNVSDPRHRQCGFGAGQSCVACPPGALCPGGFRAWPLPGFAVTTKASSEVRACSPPADARCLGWNSTLSAVACGVGYRQGSPACSACATGYYADVDSACVACPSSSSGAVVAMLAIFFAGLLGASILLYALVRLLAAWTKARTSDLPQRVLQLAVWTFTTVQVVSQVGQTAGASADPAVKAAYSILRVFQFRGVVLPAECVPGFPFLNDVLAMAAGLALAAIVGVAYSCRGKSGVLALGPTASGRCQRVLRLLRLHGKRLAVLALTLVYSPAVSTAVSMVACQATEVTVRAYRTLGSDGTALRRVGIGIAELDANPWHVTYNQRITVSILRANPSHVCYEAAHSAAAAIAWVTLVLVGVAYPCVAFVYVRHELGVRVQPEAAQHARADASPKHLAGSPAPRTWWCARLWPPPRSTQGLSASAPDCTSLAVDMPGHARRSIIDAIATELWTPELAPIISSDYRLTSYWMYAFDRYVMLVLSIATAVFASNDSGNLALVIVTVCINFGVVAMDVPFKDNWKFIVKLYSLALTLLACLTAFAGSAMPSGHALVTALQYLLLAGSVGLFVTMLFAFIRDAVQPPPPEEPMNPRSECEIRGVASQSTSQSAHDDATCAAVPAVASVREDDMLPLRAAKRSQRLTTDAEDCGIREAPQAASKSALSRRLSGKWDKAIWGRMYSGAVPVRAELASYGKVPAESKVSVNWRTNPMSAEEEVVALR